ncbi:unnamed protein product [Nezara viridula]|uniref:Uncharacterized protein n=1 Tax=Nezara viridula TaxID=85310 RepID=A0A9P0E930_NEZVI|nr:unnamed protein product [Nezara viridula]
MIYREREPDCSEVCLCRDGSLTCNTICVERLPCQTDFAFYNHAAPAYQAYRGRCLCYSGRFICMRPPPELYDLKQGVFLFLGYSELDERKLRAINQMEVQDAVTSLQDLLRLHVKPKTPCMLTLYNSSEENIILAVKLTDNSTLTKPHVDEPNPSLLMKQKEECEAPLQQISEMINSRDPIVHSHIYLSIFKTAEVDVIYPAPSSSIGLQPHTTLFLTLILLIYLS